MAVAFLGLGSNLGNREKFLAEAVCALKRNSECEIRRLSSIYETEPWGTKEQKAFLNQVVAVDTEASPRDLLRRCQEIEQDLGRQKGEQWGPRTIDIDILLYENLSMRDDELQIPHPLLAERRFFLVPLAELASGDRVPNYGKTVQELLDACEDSGWVTLYQVSERNPERSPC